MKMGKSFDTSTISGNIQRIFQILYVVTEGQEIEQCRIRKFFVKPNNNTCRLYEFKETRNLKIIPVIKNKIFLNNLCSFHLIN